MKSRCQKRENLYEMRYQKREDFCESEEPFKIICAGSLLGVKLRRMRTSFPVGKVKILNMYPMDFEEFLLANGNYINLYHHN